MVRKKRKAMVTNGAGAADAPGGATGTPAPARVGDVVQEPPLNACVPVSATNALQVPGNGATTVSTGGEPLPDLTAWYARLSAAPTLYDQLRIVQLFRAFGKKLTGEEPGLAVFVEATWRLVFRLYSARDSGLPGLCKQFALVLQDLVGVSTQASDPCVAQGLATAAREELRRFLATLFAESTASAGTRDPDEVVQVVSHLQMMLEFPFLLRVLINDNEVVHSGQQADVCDEKSYLLRTVRFIADQLAFLARPIAEFRDTLESTHLEGEGQVGNGQGVEGDDEGAAGPTNAVLKASERCSAPLKCMIVMCTLKDDLYSHLVASSTSIEGAEAFEEAARDVMRLLDKCVLILTTTVVHKDLLTQTGLAYCLLLRLLVRGYGGESVDTTSVLLQALYSDVSVVIVDRAVEKAPGLEMNASLVAHLQQDMKSFGEFARLAVLRGYLNSLSDDELLVHVASTASSTEHDHRTLLDFVFGTVHAACHEESLNTRLYAFQVLEAFMRRAVAMLNKRPTEGAQIQVHDPITTATVAALTGVVLLNWENPSKRVNQFMQVMFTHIVNYQASVQKFDEWKLTIAGKLMQLPAESRARYGGLAILTPRYGALALLDQYPGFLRSILLAVGIKDVSAAAAALFTLVLDELNTAGKGGESKKSKKISVNDGFDSQSGMNTTRLREYWMEDVVDVLLSPDVQLRSSVAMYALPLLLKRDPECVPGLIERMRQHGKYSDAHDVERADVILWAVVEVLKFARKKISPEKLLGLEMTELEAGMENARPEARGAAFEALCASLKSTNLPTAEELRLIQRFLVLSAKEITASTRMNSLNSLKTVLFRVKETIRIHSKQIEQQKQRPDGQVTTTDDTDVIRAREFQRWLELFIVTSVYPGALVQRSIIGLEVLALYLQIFGVPAAEDNSLLMTPHMVTCLLNTLIGSWDVVRALANTILDHYPTELPGFTTAAQLEKMWQWALTLCISPRQRESDAGAHFMQLLYRRSQSLVCHDVASLPSQFEPSVAMGKTALRDGRVRVVLKLAEIIDARLNSAAEDLARGESPLVHGLLLSLRYMIESTDASTLREHHVEWRFALSRVLACVHRSMKLSLAVVGDATSGIGDETLSDTFEGGIVGEVSAAGGKTEAIPLRVDCRGHLILDGKSAVDGDNEPSDGRDTEQRAVVGSWLAARECGAILDALMRRLPLPLAVAGVDVVDVNFFSTEVACQAGEMLLNSLFELKHKGAVATAYEAFEGVCKSFLAHADKNAVIGGLPALWAARLLERLERSEQQFILRRSSGFAFSFVAILRAEPRNTAASILPRVMATLLRLAAQDTDAMTATDGIPASTVITAAPAASNGPNHHLVWRSRVHALNILKLISQDAVLADDVAVYVSTMLEIAVFGFECRSWVVRNSSMMLFAAATQRALGDKRIADGASKLKVPSADVFSRFPQLDGFLFRALQRFTEHSTASDSSVVVPPGLYPVLMFLSRLRPTDEDEDREMRARGSTPLADFVPLVRQCASQSVLPIRSMAAKVLGAIVREDQAASVLAALSSTLPKGVSSASRENKQKVDQNVDGNVPEQRTPLSSNYVHGVLLQAKSVIQKCLVAAAQTPNEAHTTMMTAVHSFLSAHSWLVSERVMCGSIRAVMYEINEDVARWTAERLAANMTNCDKEALKSSKLECIASVDALLATNNHPTATRSPGVYQYNRALVGVFFAFVECDWHLLVDQRERAAQFVTTWLPRVEELLQCPVLEVRKRAFTKVAKFVHNQRGLCLSDHISIAARLQRVLVAQLLIETHPTVKKRLLRLLVECQDTCKQSKTTGSLANPNIEVAPVAGILVLLSNSADVDVLAPSLTLLATFLRDGLLSKEEDVVAFARAIVLHAGEDQPLGLRFAAATAIQQSEILCSTSQVVRSEPMEITVDLWLAAIELLQDDDAQVRDVIRRAVYVALDAQALPKTPSAAMALTASMSETKMLPAAICFFTETLACTPYGMQALAKLLLSTVDAPKLLVEHTTGTKAQDWGDLCSRIFETEASNFYAEHDLLAQLIATALFPPAGQSWTLNDVSNEVRASRSELKRELLQRLVTSLSLVNKHASSPVQWLGGITYYAGVFPPLFSLLCAGVAVLGSLTDAEKVESASALTTLAQEAKMAHSYLQSAHPLIEAALITLSADVSKQKSAHDDALHDLVFLTPSWRAIA